MKTLWRIQYALWMGGWKEVIAAAVVVVLLLLTAVRNYFPKYRLK